MGFVWQGGSGAAVVEGVKSSLNRFSPTCSQNVFLRHSLAPSPMMGERGPELARWVAGRLGTGLGERATEAMGLPAGVHYILLTKETLAGLDANLGKLPTHLKDLRAVEQLPPAPHQPLDSIVAVPAATRPGVAREEFPLLLTDADFRAVYEGSAEVAEAEEALLRAKQELEQAQKRALEVSLERFRKVHLDRMFALPSASSSSSTDQPAVAPTNTNTTPAPTPTPTTASSQPGSSVPAVKGQGPPGGCLWCGSEQTYAWHLGPSGKHCLCDDCAKAFSKKTATK